MNDGDTFMVIILVIMHVIESPALWCTSFGLVLVYSGSMVGIQERVASSIWESVKHYLW